MSNELPENARRLFPHYDDPTRLPKTSPHLVLARLLEEGEQSDLRWLTARYPRSKLTSWLERHGPRQLSRRSLSFWRILVEQEIDADPRPGEPLWPL